MTNPNHPSVDQSDRVVPYNLRQSGRTPVQMLISTQVRKSPFWHLSHEAGCWRATVYNRIYHPRGYVKPEDGGAMVEYEALVNRVTMWNVAVEAIEFAKKMEDSGAGELLVTSMDRDGTQIGYDNDLMFKISSTVNIPVIASGGVERKL